ncbi:hypothetical protein FNF29_00936 [Cafeteria roenbergensis]|uniref:Programmed cell death protein 2 C-terminal domain-containing protein n=2 Tax=Cafeteria roenbergensis TaxID=33653 RepID=A0A5A8CUS9_CAFRO|nr:hypothetical protein FNF29_00936 [Cafeteria roenbergensis]|eukprot:KAA0156826.1 hypothetical protein FNF29_00936 [Cafeteria roenbergensis]
MAELAFCEPCEAGGPLVREGTSPFSDWDGGSAGGKPAWLSPADLPGPGSLKCASCAGALRFLLQAYCPVDDHDGGDSGDGGSDNAALGGKDRAFHRMLYLFVCARPGCVAKGSVLALRCQLPKQNPVIAFKRDAVLPAPAPGQVCAVCGMPCDGTCASCDQPSSSPDAASAAAAARPGWPAFDLVLGGGDEEDDGEDGDEDGDEEDGGEGEGAGARGAATSGGGAATGASGAGSPADLAAAAASAGGGDSGGRLAALEGVGATGDDDTSQGDLVRAIGGDERLAKVAAQLAEDECFAHFEVETRKDPDQVMRYARWQDDAVLWASDTHRPAGAADPAAEDLPSTHGGPAAAPAGAGACGPAACVAKETAPGTSACLAVGPKGASGLEDGCRTVPPCESCGAPRKFEMQVMPQLIHFLQPEETATGGAGAGGAGGGAAAAAAAAGTDGAHPRAKEAAGGAPPRGTGEELDFQTLVVYTCSRACRTGQAGLGAYSREFVWVQTE